MGVLVMKDREWFRSLGVTPPDEFDSDYESNKLDAVKAFRDIMEMCGIIRSEALRQGFTADEAYDFAMSYYGVFLSVNFQAAYDARKDQHRGDIEE
jgi:hypothetical protein